VKILSSGRERSPLPSQSIPRKSRPVSPETYDDPPSEPLLLEEQSYEDRLIAVNAQLLLCANGPQSLITKGQSDPFDALAIPITAEVNQIIAFGRDVFLPALHHTTSAKNSIIVKRNFEANITQLKDEGSALGLLACYATAARQVCRDSSWMRKALHYEARCAALLRERLRSAPKSLHPEIITQILSLLGCAIVTVRKIEAEPHSRILRAMFDVSEHGPEDIARLCFILYHDRNMSVIHMVRPTFDVSSWVPQVIAPILDGPTEFPHLTERPSQKLDSSITRVGTSFTKLIEDIRNHYFTLVLTQERWPPADIPSNLSMYHLSHSVLYEIRIINYYLDMTEKRQLPPEDLWPQACICLAVLYMRHSRLYSPVIDGIRRNDTSLLLKHHFQDAILSAHRTATLLSKKRYCNVLLWALFIGATAERVGTAASVDHSYWFNAGFEAHALSMGLTKWSDVHAIILGFPCSPELLNQDMAWAEESLKPAYERDGKVRLEATAFRTYNNETGSFD
jgi:hypothetical protein